MKPNENRICWADTLKGILIILVVLGHSITNYSSMGESFLWNQICDAIYLFHMPAFFIISGYLQAVSSEGKRIDQKYILRKIVSIGVPMIVFSVLYWAVKYVAALVGGGVTSTPPQISDLLLMFVFPIGEYWFLYAMLLITLVDVLFHKIKLPLGVQFAIWISLLFVVNYIPGTSELFWKSALTRVCRFGIYFFVGKLLFYKFEKYKTKPVIILIVIIAILSWILWGFVDGFDDYVIPKLILACATTFLGIIIFYKSGPSFVGQLGKNSLDIYLLHVYFVVACKIILPRFIHDMSIYFLLTTIISIGLSFFAKLIISKIKYLDFVFKPLKYINIK